MSALAPAQELQFTEFMEYLEQKNPHQPEFLQAVREVAGYVVPFIASHPKYQGKSILYQLTEPDRIVQFRVTWVDDQGRVQVNRGYRVQFNNTIGPYKGGLRFHPSVNASILKFLAFEQIFKNSLTGLPLGGGKGGADFNPKGKTDTEIMRFCQAFMLELARHVGPHTDVPAGDIGVGQREVGYMFGMYRKLRNEHTGVITGKGISYGGSKLRPEATGYGLLFFVEEMLKEINEILAGKKVVISGAGNVAQYAAEKTLQMGGIVLALSDSKGAVYAKEGITEEMLARVMHIKNVERGSLKTFADEYKLLYMPAERPWSIPCDIALPCATQNELNEKEAKQLIANGCKLVAEGANMPCTEKAIAAFQEAETIYAPGKASNAGGVATSGLEMTQNYAGFSWSEEEVEIRLRNIMERIHSTCKDYGQKEGGGIDYLEGANVGGFVKVADAMIEQGVL
jgi:glutamate dehydrogenase (NADP+)